MTKVDIKLHGKDYTVSCETSEVTRLKEIVKFVDGKMNEISKKTEGMSETRIFLLTCLTLADDLLESKRSGSIKTQTEEDLMVAAVQHLNQRVAAISTQVGKI